MFLLYTKDSDPPTHVRSGPGVNHQKIGDLKNHTVITVLEKTNNNWLKISEPFSGFIYGNLAQPKFPQFYREQIGSIAAWQHFLNGCGYHPDAYPKLVITGEFDAATIAVTKKLQQDLGLPETGNVIDLCTWQKAFDHKKLPGWLPVVPPIPGKNEPPDDNLCEADKYDYCRQVILSNGSIFFENPNQRNLLTFRQETSTKANDWKGEYDDWTFLIWKDGTGQKRCCKYKSNTEPSSWYEDSPDPRAKGPILGRDANGDGRKDLGRLQEGYYEYETGWDNVLKNVLRPTQEARSVIRDIDHDGIFEPNEPIKSAGYTMLFHQGCTGRTGSAGCQTMEPDVYDRFWDELNANGNPGVVGYTIVRWKSL